VRTSLQALEDNNESAYLAAFADDAELGTLESPSPLRGKSALRSYFSSMRNAINYLATSIENIWGAGPFVAVEYQIVGEQRGALGWVPAQTDRLVKISVIDVAEVHKGKIVHISRYDDPSQIAAP
jgi:hypothetical protein